MLWGSLVKTTVGQPAKTVYSSHVKGISGCHRVNGDFLSLLERRLHVHTHTHTELNPNKKGFSTKILNGKKLKIGWTCIFHITVSSIMSSAKVRTHWKHFDVRNNVIHTIDEFKFVDHQWKYRHKMHWLMLGSHKMWDELSLVNDAEHAMQLPQTCIYHTSSNNWTEVIHKGKKHPAGKLEQVTRCFVSGVNPA